MITDTSSGIGTETARNLDKAKAALDGILELGRVGLVEMGNTSLKSMLHLVKDIVKKSDN